MSTYHQEAAMAHGAGSPLWRVALEDDATGEVLTAEVVAADQKQAVDKASDRLNTADLSIPARQLHLRYVRLAGTVQASMCHQFRSGAVTSSTVAVDRETGEFDEARAFADTQQYVADDCEMHVGEYLMLGVQRFEVEPIGDPAIAYFNEGTLAWSSVPRAGYAPVPVDLTVNQMPMRVVDMMTFCQAIAEGEGFVGDAGTGTRATL
jgi:hypothetical protein